VKKVVKILLILLIIIAGFLLWMKYFAKSTTKKVYSYNENTPAGIIYTKPTDIMPSGSFINPLDLEKNFATYDAYTGRICLETKEKPEQINLFKEIIDTYRGPFKVQEFTTTTSAMICAKKYIIIKSSLSGIRFAGPFDIK